MIVDRVLKYSTHSGKLEGFHSLNVWKNCSKKWRDDDSTVCSKCYWYRLYRYYDNLNNVLKHNRDLMKKHLEPEQIPWINDKYFRFSSFGDISTVKQVQEFVFVAQRNPDAQIGWWTKEPKLLMRGIKKAGYFPGNICMNISSLLLNVPQKWNLEWPSDTKVFTVYTKDKMPKQSKINKKVEHICKSQCRDCLVCYTKNKIKYVHEELK